MAVDSSALICILLGEPEAVRFAHALATANSLLMAALTWLEMAMVIKTHSCFLLYWM